MDTVMPKEIPMPITPPNLPDKKRPFLPGMNARSTLARSLWQQDHPEVLPQSDAFTEAGASKRWSVSLLLCTIGFVICTLLTVTPLMRAPDSVLKLHLAPGDLLAKMSNWLPTNIGTITQSTYGEFFLLFAIASLCYGLAAWLIQRQTTISKLLLARNCIWIGTVLAGLIYVVTPAMLSHDILVYASYSRVLGVYHANPYFTPIAAFPHDPFTPLNYWRKSVSAYGPIWTLICGLWGWLLNPEPASYVLAFRLSALALHLLNTWLIGRALQTLGRSPRTVTLGMLLYAWNPLVLLESCLGGHNDVFMLTFVLVGIILAARAEKNGNIRLAQGYLPPVIALTLATLVKFTALPILAAYLLLLICRTLLPSSANSRTLKQALGNWFPALLALLWSGLVIILIALIFYGPFWFGHSLKDISNSFKNPPSAIGAENSFMRSTIEWLQHHPTLKPNGLLMLLTNRHFWDDLNYIAITICLLLGARQLWSKPTTRTFVTVALATMCTVLLITPWFFSWYITWILGLAVICLPVHQNRTETALLALTLTFSFSALFTYLFNAGLFDPQYYLVSLFTTIPPVCAFLLTLVSWRLVDNSRTGDTEK
jgi:hypothetical protein